MSVMQALKRLPGLSLGMKTDNGNEWEWLEWRGPCATCRTPSNSCVEVWEDQISPRREKELLHEITIPVAKTLNKLFKA